MKKFITFEGGEGVGKSTQIKRFEIFLQNEFNQTVTTTFEPGGVQKAMEIRQKVKFGGQDKYTATEEVQLFMEACKHFVEELVKPALKKKHILISDRYVDSTFAYQGYGKGAPLEMINQMYKATVGDLWPDLTFILDAPIEMTLTRARKRDGESENNRFENMVDSIHQKIREGFIEIAKKNPERCVLIDATGTEEQVQGRIRNAFLEKTVSPEWIVKE